MSGTSGPVPFSPEALRGLVEQAARAASAVEALDRICEAVVSASGWRRACYAVTLPTGLAMGAAGLPPGERGPFEAAMRTYGPEVRGSARARVLDLHRLADGLDAAFVPQGFRVELPPLVLPGPGAPGDAPDRWRAGDELVLLPHDADGTSLGVLALAAPAAGRRPTPEDAPALAALLDAVALLAQVVVVRAHAFDAGQDEARRILAYVETLTETADPQVLVDRMAELCARIAGYHSAVLTVHVSEGPLLGTYNVTAAQRAGLLAAAERTTPGRSAARRQQVRAYAFPGTGICYVPHDADLARSSGYVSTPQEIVGSWHPDDRLFVMVRTVGGADFGVLSLDLPDDGGIPTEAHLGPLRVAERFLQLGAALLEARRLDAHLTQSHRLEALGTLAAGVAHDFNNIIGVMLGYSSLLRMRVAGQADLERMATAVEESAVRAAALTARLRGLTRGGGGEPRRVDVGQLAQDCARVARETFDRRIEIESRIDADLPPVAGDVAALYRSLMNLCVNARDALPEGGRLRLEVTASERVGVPGHEGTRTWVEIRVDDDGPGLEAGVAERIFEPFFTTHGRSERRGLGLFTAYNVVRAHGGSIQAGPSPLGGTCFRMLLPAAEGAAETRPLTGPQGFPLDFDDPVPPAHVLVVEDEEMLQDLVVTALELLGHSADVVGDGEAAIERLAERPRAYDLVVLDLVLPRRSGLEVFRHAQTVAAPVPVLLSSGNIEEGLGDAGILEQVAGVVEKPWRLEDFQEAVQQVMRAGAARRGEPPPG